MKLILQRPVVTEKSAKLQNAGKYTFVVNNDANKIEIKKEVESRFGVKVTNVNTMNYEGATKRVGRFIGKKSDYKKAVVTLEKGQTIELYDQAE